MTIFALSSGPGISGIAVTRITGRNTLHIIKTLTKKIDFKPRTALFCKVYNKNNEIIDEAIILWFPGPNSYTGSDLAEIHTHGSRAVINAIHENLLNFDDCRLAEPGEFTKLAFQNGKINLLKAESIADLISSETEIQRQQAIKIMNGKSADQFNFLREKLLKILSHVEAKIDFPDEDLPNNILDEIKNSVSEVTNKIEKILNDQKVGEKIREGFKIAIIGPANAGKSSLMNYLSKRDIAIVSEIAGTTRDVIEAHLNIDGYPAIISDTAGIRESQNEIEKMGIKLSLDKAQESDLKLIVVDVKNLDFNNLLKNLLDENAILVLNKSELLEKDIDSHIKKTNHVLISIKENRNIDELILKIKNFLKNKFIASDDILITRERHRQHLQQCLNYLNNFNQKKELDDFDKAAEDLRLATRHLGMIVGKFDVEEILGSIFNDFCIGK